MTRVFARWTVGFLAGALLFGAASTVLVLFMRDPNEGSTGFLGAPTSAGSTFALLSILITGPAAFLGGLVGWVSAVVSIQREKPFLRFMRAWALVLAPVCLVAALVAGVRTLL